MKLRRFRIKKGLWGTVSFLVFLFCWICPMSFDKGACYAPIRLWLDLQRVSDLWEVAILSVQFGAFAALIGFTVQALVVILTSRNAEPGPAPNGGPAKPFGNSEVIDGPQSVR
jgi:hypothetical protein